MKTMIANAEKLEKLGELIDVVGNNVQFGGNVEVDGIVVENQRAAIERSLTSAGSIMIELPTNTIYVLSLRMDTEWMTMLLLVKGSQISYSSITFNNFDETRCFAKYSPSSKYLQFYSMVGDSASTFDTQGMSVPVIIKPIASI